MTAVGAALLIVNAVGAITYALFNSIVGGRSSDGASRKPRRRGGARRGGAGMMGSAADHEEYEAVTQPINREGETVGGIEESIAREGSAALTGQMVVRKEGMRLAADSCGYGGGGGGEGLSPGAPTTSHQPLAMSDQAVHTMLSTAVATCKAVQERATMHEVTSDCGASPACISSDEAPHATAAITDAAAANATWRPSMDSVCGRATPFLPPGAPQLNSTRSRLDAAEDRLRCAMGLGCGIGRAPTQHEGESAADDSTWQAQRARAAMAQSDFEVPSDIMRKVSVARAQEPAALRSDVPAAAGAPDGYNGGAGGVMGMD